MINLDTNLYSIILKEVQRNESSIFLIKRNGQSSCSNIKNFKECLPKNCNFFYIDYNYDTSYEPYSPFCSIINNFTKSKLDLNYLLDNLSIYPAHKEIFKSYLIDGHAKRIEEILPFDFSYEKSKLYNEFLNIFNFYGKKGTLIITLENINKAPTSTIDWLKWLFSNSVVNDFKIILTLDDYCYCNPNYQNQFDDLIQLLELEGLILELSNKLNFSEDIEINNKSIVYNSYSDNLIIAGDNYYNFFALNEALDCYLTHYNLLCSKFNHINLDEICNTLVRLGNTYCLMANYDESLKYYDILLNNSLEYGSDYFKLIAIQKLSMLNILKKKYTIAETLAKQSYTLAKKLNIDELLFNSYSLIFWINEFAKYRTNLNKFTFNNEFIELAKKYKKKNMLAYFLTHSFNEIEYAGPEDNKVTYYNEGQRLAKELDNQNCILSSYLKTALVYAVRGFYNVSISYYKKVETLLSEMKDYFRLAQTYNGMGYYYLTNEDYVKANSYYDLALSNLRYTWNFDEICMAIFNKGFNFLLSSNYTKANECFNICLSILNVLKVDRLRLTTLTRLYGIIGLNNFYLGNYYKAYSFLSNMKSSSIDAKTEVFKDDDDEFFLANLLQGLLLRTEGKLEDAKGYFEKANYYLDIIEGSLKCLLPKFTYEYYNLLISLNDINGATKYKNMGIKYCIDNNYTYYLQILKSKTPNAIEIPDDSSSMDWVIEAAKQQASLNELNSKVDEINFLNLFQENLSSLDDLEKVLSSSMTLIENRFALDYSFMFIHEESELNLIYSSTKKRNINNELVNIMNLLDSYKTAFVYPDHSTSVNKDLSLFIKKAENLINSKIHSFIYVPILKDNKLKASFFCLTKVAGEIFNNEITLNNEFLRTINLSIKQLFETIRRIRGQQKLLQSAYTDMLTSLCNRQGFYNKLSNLLDNKATTPSTLTLFYIDLDNFKYYNDTFGHKIGDEVLIWFGDILRSLVPKNNLPIRYGGDEFLLLLQDYHSQEILDITNKIYSKLEKHAGFVDRISCILNRNIIIPKEKLLSCSIGIITTDIANCTCMSDFIEKADKAMYEAKKRGKHQFILANSI
ncbi:tetratricopeptide repeat-containing diguanylate cyclase [Clostridioides difficile]